MSIDNLIESFRSDFDLPADLPINAQSKFRELIAWSSLNALVVIITIENEFDVIVKDEELKLLNTFEDLYGLIQSKAEEDA